MVESKAGNQSVPRRVPTLQDLAKHLNVGPRTVSQVLNCKPGSTTRVSEATAKRIRELAAQWNYRPNGLARAMRGKGLCQIGFIVEYRLDGGRLSPDVAMPGILGASDYLTTRDWHLRIIREDGGDGTTANDMPKYLREHVVDGVILNSVGALKDEEILGNIKKNRVPYVIFNGVSEYNGVCLDDFSGISQLVNHLAGLGHRRITYVGPRLAAHHSIEIRQNAYRHAMTEVGLVPNVWNYLTDIPSEERRDPVREVLREQRGVELLNYYRQNRPSAMICYSDLDALLAIQVFAKHQIRIPEDVSIVGYNDLPYASMSNPPLTTIRPDFYKLGWEAARMLLQAIEQPEEKMASSILRPELIVRKSTRSVSE